MATYRNLKHFPKYLKKLCKFSKEMGFKVRFTDDEEFDEQGEFNPTKKQIKIGIFEKKSSEVIALLLHEMGHVLDHHLSKGFSFSINRAYFNMYMEKSTRNQQEIVLECEKRAWEYGEGISRCCGIKLGKWFKDKRRECLRAYSVGNS